MTEYASPRAIAEPPQQRGYLPGMGFDWLLPLYDPFTRLLGIQAAHQQLAEQAELESARRVLEIGCGTGNLALLVKRMRPQLDVVGLDPDPKALARADRKARRAGLSLELDRGNRGRTPVSRRQLRPGAVGLRVPPSRRGRAAGDPARGGPRAPTGRIVPPARLWRQSR